MKTKTTLLSGAVIVLLITVGYGLYALGMHSGMTMSRTQSTPTVEAAPSAGANPQKASNIDPATGKKVLYWHDPMVPGQRFDKPGKSPFMDMMLVPVYADGDADQGSISVSPRVQQSLGVRTAEVVRGSITPRIDAVGSIAYNERDQVLVQARTTGYIEKLYVRATLDHVSKGQPLAELYAPDWVAAQEEFLSVRRMQGQDLASLVDAARSRMRQVGMNEEQINLVKSTAKVHPRITITAPIGGVVAELMAREGMTVMPGATLFRISGLGTVWANAEVPESQVALLRPGTAVEARSAALPGTLFKGKVQAILPEVNPNTRTLKARVELANLKGQLAPGMFVSVALAAAAGLPSLLEPTEAVIQTGNRTVVMLAEVNGKFRPVNVEAGIESSGRTEIKRGLEAGQKVVVSGQFLVDSEASLRAAETRMGASSVPAPSAAAEHQGEGSIETIHKESVTLSHGPIASLQWGAMTMDFGLPKSGVPAGLKPGQRVQFAFTLSKNATPTLTRIEPISDTGTSTKRRPKP